MLSIYSFVSDICHHIKSLDHDQYKSADYSKEQHTTSKSLVKAYKTVYLMHILYTAEGSNYTLH